MIYSYVYFVSLRFICIHEILLYLLIYFLYTVRCSKSLSFFSPFSPSPSTFFVILMNFRLDYVVFMLSI